MASRRRDASLLESSSASSESWSSWVLGVVAGLEGHAGLLGALPQIGAPPARLLGTDERSLGLAEQVPVGVGLVGVGCDAAAQGDLDLQGFILVAENKRIGVEEGADLLGCEGGRPRGPCRGRRGGMCPCCIGKWPQRPSRRRE